MKVKAELNVSAAQDPEHPERGIARYTYHQLRALTKLENGPVSSVEISDRLPLTRNLDFLVGRGLLRRSAQERAKGVNVYHSMFPMDLRVTRSEVLPIEVEAGAVATVATVYDLIPLIYQERYLTDPTTRNAYLTRLQLLFSFDHLLAISEATKRDLVSLLGIKESRVSVIYAGVDDRFSPETPIVPFSNSQRAPSLGRNRHARKRVVYVGGIDHRKNVERLVMAFGRLPRDITRDLRLSIVCSVRDQDAKSLTTLARQEGLNESQFEVTGYVTDSELVSLYRDAELFVYPSEYEGFGLPVAEAMNCGIPVVASNSSSIPEVLGDHLGTFDPTSVSQMRDVMARALNDGQYREDLLRRSERRAGAFSWERVAEKTMEGYESAMRSRSGSSRMRSDERNKPHLAFYTPWPPDQSGISTYNKHLCSYLSTKYDVTVVVGDDSQARCEVENEVTIVSQTNSELAWAARPPDVRLYAMGNSHFHGYVYEELRRRPGIVDLHDVELTGFAGWACSQGSPGPPWQDLSELLRHFYPDRLDTLPSNWDVSDLADFNIRCTRIVEKYATRLIVHSNTAKDLVVLDSHGLDRTSDRLELIPLGMAGTEGLPEVKLRGPADARRIVSLGILSEAKQLTKLLEAFSLARNFDSRLTLKLVGGASDDDYQYWLGVADRLGIADFVEITGFLSPEAYSQAISDADLAVQLRLPGDLESMSAAVADCLSHGLPLITTDQGWLGELPSGTAERVTPSIEPGDLASRMIAMLQDYSKRRETAQAGRDLADSMSFKLAARAYQTVIDTQINRTSYGGYYAANPTS